MKSVYAFVTSLAIALVVPANAVGLEETAVPSPKVRETLAPQTPAPSQPTSAKEKCTRKGSSKSEKLVGTAKDDVICGRGGNDVIDGRGGNDVVLGESGSDVLQGRSGGDVLVGGSGTDRLAAGSGSDNLRSKDQTRELVNGGSGHDVGLVDKKDNVRRVEELVPPSGKPKIKGGKPNAVKVSTATSPEEVSAYWTPEQTASAQPWPRGGGSGAGRMAVGSESATPNVRGTRHPGSSIFPAWESGYLAAEYYSPAIGRLYFENNGPRWCTATVVARNLLLTAAHCIYDTATGTTSQNFKFYPGMIGTQTPYGEWFADSAVIYAEYFTVFPGAPFSPLDYGVVTVNWPDAYGRLVGDVTGWYPISWGGLGGPKFTEGYPAQDWFGTYCPGFECYVYINSAPTWEYLEVVPGWWEEGSGGFGHGGDSGGPIFESINGTWYVTSVISHGAIPSPYQGWMVNTWGPYFNDWVGDLWFAHALY